MIKINLLPPDLRPVKRTPLPYLAVGVLLVCAVLGMGTAWLGNYSNLSIKEFERKKNQEEFDTLQKTVQEHNSLEADKKTLQEKTEIIQEITENRIIWSRQLWNISRLTPENIWYTNVAEVEKPVPVMKPETDKTGKIEMKRVSEKRRFLEIGGIVVEGADGNIDINPLMFSLENDAEFASLFQLNMPSIVDTTMEGKRVKVFTLTYEILDKKPEEQEVAEKESGKEKAK